MIWTGAYVLIIIALIMQNAPGAEWPECKFQCQAKDVIVERLWLGDDSGAEIMSTVMDEEQSCYLWARFRNNANTPRYAAILLADLYLDGTLSRSFYDDGLCVLDEIEAKSIVDYPLCRILWKGGDEVMLKRLVLSWETARGTSCSNANRICSNRNTKCYGGQKEELLAETPIISSNCAIIGQDHACLSKTETYRVSLTRSVHGTVQWYLDGREISKNESIDIDWQNYGAGKHDLRAYVDDGKTMNEQKQWATCNMTITVTPEPVAVIGWVV